MGIKLEDVMKNTKAVIFDLDNTLVNRKLAFNNYCISFINECFKNKELPDSINTMVQDMVLLDNNGYRDCFRFYNSLIKKWNLEDYTAQQFVDTHSERFCKFTTPDIDMQLVLDYLTTKYKLGIITNGSSKTQNAKIDYIGFRNRFDSIIVSGDVGIKKPNKQIFTLSCDSLKVDVNEAVYIGDHYENDIIGAKSAGLSAIWYMRDSTCFQPFEFTIAYLSEIMNFL